MRKLASIVRISSILPIDGADKIELARMEGKGWQCVVGKGEFVPGDVAVYFEIDSLLPIKKPFTFLPESIIKISADGTQGYRIRTIRLRGQLSQGLLMPLEKLGLEDAGFGRVVLVNGSYGYVYRVGDDVTALLGVSLYEQPLPITFGGDAYCALHGIPKTDQERIQNIPGVLEHFNCEEWEITEKLDGTSCTFYYSGELEPKFGVASRSFVLKDGSNIYWQMAKKYGMEERLKHWEGFAVQGEICGPNIQKNPLALPSHEFFVFDIFDIKRQEYVSSWVRQQMVEALSLKHVPIIATTAKTFSMEEILQFADGPSLLNGDKDREGIVFKRLDQSGCNYMIPVKYTSFKVISNKYLTKCE